MVLSMLKPNNAVPRTGLAAVDRYHMRNYGGIKDPTETDSDPDRGSPKTSSLIESDDSPYQNLSPLNLFPASMLARQMLGGLSLHPTLASPVYASGWYRNPTSPPPTPVTKTKRNNNDDVTSSTSVKKTRRRIKTSPIEPPVVSSVDTILETPLSPPTSGSSPQSNGSGQEISCKSSDKDKLFTCGICQRSFGYKHVLQNHERTHTGEKPFECSICHKRFTRDHHLKTHMRLHTGEKPYHCKYCERQFVQVANLRRHLRVHTGERPYSCDRCTCKFSDSNQLKAHTLIHNGEKPHRCKFCNGKFRRKHHLLSHKCPKKCAQDIENMNEVDDHDEDSRETGLEIDEEVDSTRSSPTHDFDEYAHIKTQGYITNQSPDNYLISINNNRKMRERKSRDIRRVIRVPDISGPILDPLTIPPLLPEQTEPEDLSMPKSKLRNQLTQNNNHEVSSGHQGYYVVDSGGESPHSFSRSPSLEIEKEALTSLYNHPKLRRHVELIKTNTVS